MTAAANRPAWRITLREQIREPEQAVLLEMPPFAQKRPATACVHSGDAQVQGGLFRPDTLRCCTCGEALDRSGG